MEKDYVKEYILHTEADSYLTESAIGSNRFALVIHLLSNDWFKDNISEIEKKNLQEYSELMRSYKSLNYSYMETTNLTIDQIKSKLSDIFPDVWATRNRLLLLDGTIKNEKN